LIHPSGASVSFYWPFTKSISDDYTIYAIQSPFLLSDYACIDNMDEIADIYLGYIRNEQKEGPYILGGASFGGGVAHAVASKLLQKNETVRLLFMMDTPAPTEKPSIKKKDIETLAYLFDININFDEMHKSFFEKSFLEQIKYLKNSKLCSSLRIFTIQQIEKIYKICKDNANALWGYKPKPISQKILYFLATERSEFSPHINPSQSWKPYTTQDLDVIEILGNHKSINQYPNVKKITNYIETYLKEML